jgi:hypothetical protein
MYIYIYVREREREREREKERAALFVHELEFEAALFVHANFRST